MNSDESGKTDANSMPNRDRVELKVADHVARPEVPVFTCIVYVSQDVGIGVRGRVANLTGLEFSATNEREVLAKIVPAFRQRIAELMQREAPIPWTDPPSPPKDGELVRLLPVHL